jgi:hypothetical protein
VVLLLEIFLVVPGVSLTRGEAILQQALRHFVPRSPLGLCPSWVSLLEATTHLCIPLQDPTTGQRSSVLCRLC